MPWIWIAFWTSLAITILLLVLGLLTRPPSPAALLRASQAGKILPFPAGIRMPELAMSAIESVPPQTTADATTRAMQ